MTTNNLFRDLLENRIPGHETPTFVWVEIEVKIPPRFYFLPTLADPTAPTVAELNKAVDISKFVEITNLGLDEFAETIRRLGAAASKHYAPPELAIDPRERALAAQQTRNTGPAATPLRVRGRNTHYKEKS